MPPKVRKTKAASEADNPIAQNDPEVPHDETRRARYVVCEQEDTLLICVDCGSVVVDGDLHDAFHDVLERVADYNGQQ